MTFAGHERRLPNPEGDGEVLVLCRVCWARIRVDDPERVELADGRAYLRCPDCGGSSLMRWEDAVRLGRVDS
jgi:DNA-directed RNA polymerase subunit RPC12/RpoP